MNHRFDYDDDPEIRALEQELERPALRAKAARAQARVRRRMRLTLVLGGFLFTLAVGWGWCFFKKNESKATAPAEQKIETTPSIFPEKTTPPNQASPPSPPAQTPENQNLEQPKPIRKTPPPPVAVAVIFEGRAEHFAPDIRVAVEALRLGKLPEAERQLALLEKPLRPSEDEELRALDDDEAARLDTLDFLKGLTRLQLRRFPEAVASLVRLDEAGKPWQAEAQFYLFQAYFLSGEKKRASALLEKMRRSPGHPFLKTAEKWAQAAGGL